MHHALHIDEILLNVFTHCNSPRYKHGQPSGIGSDLFALARTCHAFKDPALDVLWSELPDLCPLALCLPHVCYRINPGSQWYSFKRPLEQAEWDTLKNYTRRVRSVLDFESAFHPDCVRKFLNPSSSGPLFPNLRYLRCIFANEITPLLQQPLPSLTALDYSFVFEGCLPLLQESFEHFPRSSPSMKKLSIRVHEPEPIIYKIVSDFVCRWPNPHVVLCPQISLDVNALVHLSRVPGLSQLSFTANAVLPDEITPDTLLFSSLQEMKLFSDSLGPISKFLACTQLPALTDIAVQVSARPSKQDMFSFWTVLQSCGAADSITRLKLSQIHRSSALLCLDTPVLTADDLWPCMAFTHLRRIDLNIGWNVHLTDDDLVELASAWPHLEQLLINEEWGWKTTGGITPNGLVRLLQACRSLCRLALAIDVRGYTDVPPELGSNATLALAPAPAAFSINVVDAILEAESVPALAIFFSTLASVPRAQFSLKAWRSWAFAGRSGKRVYVDRWNRVGELVASGLLACQE